MTEEDEPIDRITAFFNRCADGRETHLRVFKALSQTLSEELSLNIHLDVFTEETAQAYEEQWQPLLQNDDHASGDRYTSSRRIKASIYQTDPKGDISRAFNENYDPFHFNLAIWVDDTLCGLAYGGHIAEIERDYISIKVMEGHPDPEHPLKGKIADIIDRASKDYAKSVNVSKIARIGPFSEGAKRHHEANGLKSELLVYN
jgi:hypothetical protein